MPNFNFNINNIKEGSEPILMAARTAQSMSRKNSISALAKDLIMQYPVLISRSISVENALIVTMGLERQFAALQMLVLSADSAFGVDPGKNAGVRDLISKYHSNADTPDMINFACNVIDNLGTVSKHLGSLESAETNTENTEVKINGIPNPSEKINSIIPPFKMFSDVALIINALLKNTPTHGVQHTEKIIPNSIDEKKLNLSVFFFIPLDLFNIFILNIPI